MYQLKKSAKKEKKGKAFQPLQAKIKQQKGSGRSLPDGLKGEMESRPGKSLGYCPPSEIY